MKKFFSLLVCISLLSALFLSGCSSSESNSEGNGESTEGGTTVA